jgi:pyruvate carboxylase
LDHLVSSSLDPQSSILDPRSSPPPGTRARFLDLGPEKFSRWIIDQKPLFITDTTFRTPTSLY